MLAGRREKRISEGFKRLLEELKAADKRCIVQGSSRHQHEYGPPLVEEELKDFEKTHGIRLPCEYREHLLDVGNGSPHITHDSPIQTGPGPGYGLSAFDALHIYPEARLPFPFSTCDSPVSYQRLEDECFEDLEHIPGTLEIATEGCAHQYLLVLNGPHSGSLWSYSDGCPLLFLEHSFSHWMHEWATSSLHSVRQLPDEPQTIAQKLLSQQGKLTAKLHQWFRSVDSE